MDLKRSLNRCVFSFDLNDSKLSVVLRFGGRSFQTVGPPMLNDLAAKVLDFARGTSRRLGSLDERSLLVGSTSVMRFLRYSGAFPYMHLCTRVAILCCILCSIGNQCSVYIASEALLYLSLLRSC